MGKGGGGSQPQTTTAYQTNLPEYAKPYVMNMLGAAQNQLFETSGGDITGFRPYTPYSTDPTQYFAGPSSLQTSVYNEAGQMQTPGQFAPATGLAGMAGMGQLGTAQQAGTYGGLGTALGAAGAMQAMPAFSAGQQYAQQVTDPRAYSAYMSPYQQQVTDIAKMNAVREAQLAGQQANLGAARQGTYGGARQALMGAEREKNLLANLSNIQAQGSQAAYDKAMQAQQFGANLGLQGIQTGLQGVQTGLQGIGQGLQGVGAQQAGYAGAGQAASTLGQLGGAQQQADLARMGFQQQTGAQQQQYQQNIINQAIQDYATAQQYPYMQLSTMSNLLRGLPMQGMSTQIYQAQPSTTQQLLGLAGTGASLYGAMKREGGTIKEYAKGGIAEDLRAKLEDMADTDPKGLAKLVAQSSSKEVKKIGNDILSGGIATANTGGLATNMAGGGIIAFNGEDGSYVDPLMQFSGLTDEGLTDDELRRKAMFEEAKKNDYQKAQRMLALEREAIGRGVRVLNPLDPSTVKDKTVTPSPDAINMGPLRKDMMKDEAPSAGAPENAATEYSSPSGLAAVLAERRKLLGIDGPGEKNQALMKALEERQAGMGKEREADRYLRMAEAFSKFGSTAGPMGSVASQALGGFAKGEALARKDEDKMKLEGMKMQADLEKARRAEERGDLDAAEKFYNSAEDRRNRLDVANQSANRQVELIERAMKDPAFMDALRSTKGLDSKTQQVALVNYTKWESGAILSDPEYKKLAKAVKDGKEGAAQALESYKEQKYNDFLAKAGGKSSGATSSSSGKVDASNPLLK